MSRKRPAFVNVLTFVALTVAATLSAASEPTNPNDPPETIAPPDGFVALFDGKSLDGWTGDAKYWSVVNGCIVGRSTEKTPVPHSEYLVWNGYPVGNFILIADFQVDAGNSGIEYRAWKDPARNFGLNGYQADVCPGDIMGLLYGEALGEIIAWRGEHVHFDKDGKKTVERFATVEEIAKSIKMNGWNRYLIEARGNRFVQYINDVKTAELVDERPNAPKTGIFGLQIHPGPPMQFRYKNIFLKSFDAK